MLRCWWSGTRSRRCSRCASATALSRAGLGGAEATFELGHLRLEFQHPLHPSEIEAFVGELLDAREQSNVGVAVTAAATAGALGFDQALSLVDSEGLRVHAGQLGRNRDHVDRPVETFVVHHGAPWLSDAQMGAG